MDNALVGGVQAHYGTQQDYRVARSPEVWEHFPNKKDTRSAVTHEQLASIVHMYMLEDSSASKNIFITFFNPYYFL
jgi:hypothetical protein